MFMLGYENEGTDSLYTFNKDTKGMPADSRWMFSLSQMFPYPGKRALKGEMATRDAEGMKAMADSMKLNTVVGCASSITTCSSPIGISTS